MTYVALVLTDKSHEILVNRFKNQIPKNDNSNWKMIAHHVTLHMGNASPIELLDLDKEYFITIKSFAHDENVMAVGVELPENIKSKNKIPHITLATNITNGAKPVMSNDLFDWKPLKNEFILSAKLKQID